MLFYKVTMMGIEVMSAALQLFLITKSLIEIKEMCGQERRF